MKVLKKLVLPFLLLFLIVTALPMTAGAEESAVPPFETDGRAACVYDVTHSRFIYSKNPDEVVNTSTSAKVMMGLIACEQLSGRMNESVTVTDKMLEGVSGYSMKLKSGESIRIKDLLYGAICASYNDAAYVLAHVCAGSSDEFVKLMNARARELGAVSTSYTNPLGYPDNAAMVTTLSDTVRIAEAAYRNATYMEICSKVSYSVPATNKSDARSFYNRNYLLSTGSQYDYYNKKCSGMNAGMSGEAGGWSVVTVAHDDGADLICIVLGGNEDDAHIYAYETVNRLVDWACAEYGLVSIFEKGKKIGTTDVKLTGFGSEKAVYLADESLDIYVPKSSDTVITYRLELDGGQLKAPISAGESIGTVNVYCNGVLVGSVPASVKDSYKVNGVMLVIDRIGQYTKSRAFIASAVCFAILLPVALIIYSRKTRRRGAFKRKF